MKHHATLQIYLMKREALPPHTEKELGKKP